MPHPPFQENNSQGVASRTFPASDHTQRESADSPTGPLPAVASESPSWQSGTTARSGGGTPSGQAHQGNTTQEREIWLERRGPLGMWLKWTAPPRPSSAQMNDLKVRERVRRAETISLSSLLIFAFILALTGNSLSDPSTGVAVATMAVVLTLALVFNRLGHPGIASYTFIISLMFVIMLSIVGAQGGLRLIWMPAYDLFAIPIFLSALITRKTTTIWLIVIACVFIMLSFTFLPHAQLSSPLGAHNFDEIQYEMDLPNFGWWQMIDRHIFLNGFAGLCGYLAAYIFDKSLAWAEQAKLEAIEANNKAFSQEQMVREVNHFLEEVIGAFVSQANGQPHAYIRQRAPSEPFYGAVLLLNERLGRFERLRRQANDLSNVHLLYAAQKLSNLLHQINIGAIQAEALAPERFRTQVEPIDQISNQIYILLYHQANEIRYRESSISAGAGERWLPQDQ